jgi:hypothetical protein
LEGCREAAGWFLKRGERHYVVIFRKYNVKTVHAHQCFIEFLDFFIDRLLRFVNPHVKDVIVSHDIAKILFVFPFEGLALFFGGSFFASGGLGYWGGGGVALRSARWLSSSLRSCSSVCFSRSKATADSRYSDTSCLFNGPPP